MKSLFVSLFLSILFFVFVGLIHGSIDYHEEKTGDDVEYVVMMGKIIRFVNRHHAEKKAFKFALVGSTIDSIEKSNDTTDEDEDADYGNDYGWNGDYDWYSVEGSDAAGGANVTIPIAAPGATTPTPAPTKAPTGAPGVTTPTPAPTQAPTGAPGVTTPTPAPTKAPTGAPGVTTSGPNSNTTTAPVKPSNGTTWHFEMSDKTMGKMKIRDVDNVTHYEFTWPGAENPIAKRELCLYFSEASWYGSYQRYNPEWPLNAAKEMPLTPFNYLLDYTLNPLTEEFYLILEHLYINSDGYAILLDDKSPLFIRREVGSEPALCLSVNNKYPYLENNPDPMYRDIKVKVFAAANAKEVLDFILKKSDLIAKPTAAPADVEFSTPKWAVYSIFGQFLSAAQLYDYADHIEKQGFWNSELVLNNQWEVTPGDFQFHVGLFGSAQAMTSRLHSEKFRLKVAVKPIIADTPPNMEAHRNLYIKNQQNQLTNFIDFGVPEAADYYEADLKKLHYGSGVDGYYVTSDSLRNFHLADYWMQQTPSLLTKIYLETVAKASPSSTTTLAFKTQALPLMLQLTNAPNTPFETLLKTLIPNVLSVSIAGYSFITPYHIGGHQPGGRPTEEVYIRMVQACALLPSMTFSWGPWYYSQNAIDITKKMVELHATHAQTIIQLAKQKVEDGSPIVRPMWYEAPEDPRSFNVSDQFMLGSDLVVAPVVEANLRQRSVYLPPGNWIDAHGQVRKGPAVIKVAANLEDLPFFTRQA